MKLRLFKSGLASSKNNGFILPIILVTGFVIVLIIIAISSEIVSNNSNAHHGLYAQEAQMAADAGLDIALNNINTGGTGAIAETTLLSDSARNIKTTYQVDMTDGADTNHKTMTVTARAYSPIGSSTPKLIRKYIMDIEAVTSGTSATSISSGVGGLILNNNAKITGGDVVVNGKISLNNSSQIGLTTNPLNVRVADQICPTPPDSTYPQVCPAGSPNPIFVDNNARIYANVQATNQTDGTNMFDPGLQSGSPAPVAMPTFDRTSFKNTVSASGNTMTGADASCTSGTVSWPANVKITGDVTISNNCTAKLNGNAWISGSLTITNNAQLVVQDSLGTTMPNIVVDGSSGIVINNNAKVTPNISGTGAELLTFWSADSGCSPDCASVTGASLYNSQNTTTINLYNNGTAASSVLYAYWSKVVISNNGLLGAVAGQTVELDNFAVINFSSSVPGSDNLITTWVKRGYMRVYN